MIQILFVDDEKKILEGLRRLLYPLRTKWKMHFALSGEEALQVLEKNHIEVVVTDMKMPGMDGAELLQRVKTLYPDTIRIILSGYSEQDMVIRALGSTHIYLSKPTSREAITKSISRTIHLRELLQKIELTSLVSRMDTLPSHPMLYEQLLDLLRHDDYTLQAAVNIIRQDAGMTAKVLQLVNSAFFGLPRQVSDPALAVNLLGMDVLIALVMQSHIFSEFDEKVFKDISFDQFWMHCQTTALIAKSLAEHQGLSKREIDDSFAAGLLHDSGKIILMGNAQEKYRKVRQFMVEYGYDVISAEREVFGTSHSEVGAYLLGIWGLPTAVVEAVAYHHHPEYHDVHNAPTASMTYLANRVERVFREHNEESLHDLLEDEEISKFDLKFDLKDFIPEVQEKYHLQGATHE